MHLGRLRWSVAGLTTTPISSWEQVFGPSAILGAGEALPLERPLTPRYSSALSSAATRARELAPTHPAGLVTFDFDLPHWWQDVRIVADLERVDSIDLYTAGRVQHLYGPMRVPAGTSLYEPRLMESAAKRLGDGSLYVEGPITGTILVRLYGHDAPRPKVFGISLRP